jgi:hypothetical protein
MVTTEKYKMKNTVFRDVMPSSLVATSIFYLAHMHTRMTYFVRTYIYRVFFFCLTEKRQPNAPPDALTALRHTLRVGEV